MTPDPNEFGSYQEFMEAERAEAMRDDPEGVTAAEEKLLKELRPGKQRERNQQRSKLDENGVKACKTRPSKE